MPERPDLEYQVPILARELVGRRVLGLRVNKPVVMRVTLPGDASDLVAGREIVGVVRRGPFVRIELGPGPTDPRLLELAIHPMLAGRFTFFAAGARNNADLAVAFPLDDGRELRYRDDRQMGKVYVTLRGAWERVPGLADVGVDVLDPAVFTYEVFSALARRRRDQCKAFLLDHAALDSLGNAYADETLWEARIHPKTRVSELDPAKLRDLYEAIPRVLANARDTIATRQPALDEKLRDYLAVRQRKGEKCPRCGTTVRTCGMHGHDAFFCPTCQPEGKRKGFVDWRKVS